MLDESEIRLAPAAGPDERWMQRCLTLALQGAGSVSTNPMVGSVIVGPDGTRLGEGWHRAYGGPHAERNAVADAESRYGAETLQQATLYVNLEPCSHFGKTPPCTDLILERKIPHVVVGMVDPFPAVAGAGIERLRRHGVEVSVGVLEPACRRLNEAFIHHVRTGRPLVTLKIAQTLDGRVATKTGDARWISGLDARRLVHLWRARLDGVLIGAGTARLDDPELTVRHVEGRQPVRIVLDREGSLPADLKLFDDPFADHTLAVTGPGVRPAYAERLSAAGGRIWEVPVRGNRLDLPILLERLGVAGGLDGRALQSVLVEAGPGLATALFEQDLVDRYFVFIAPKLVGEGISTLGSLGVTRMQQALTFIESSWERLGDDLLFRGYRRPV